MCNTLGRLIRDECGKLTLLWTADKRRVGHWEGSVDWGERASCASFLDLVCSIQRSLLALSLRGLKVWLEMIT